MARNHFTEEDILQMLMNDDELPMDDFDENDEFIVEGVEEDAESDFDSDDESPLAQQGKVSSQEPSTSASFALNSRKRIFQWIKRPFGPNEFSR